MKGIDALLVELDIAKAVGAQWNQDESKVKNHKNSS